MASETTNVNSDSLESLREELATARRRLEASEQRQRVLRQLLDNQPSLIYATRHDGTILFVNQAFAAGFGRLPADFEGHMLAEVFPAEMAAAWKQNVDVVVRTGSTSSEREVYGEGAAARHYESLRFVITDADGAPLAQGGISTDITGRARAESSYADTRLILNGIVNNSPAVIYVKSTENRLMLVNPTYAAVIGRSVDDLIGRTEDEIFPAELVESWRESDRELFASGQPMQYPNTFYIDGQPREFITVQFPLYDSERRPYAICGISTDVTEIKRSESERATLQEQIIQAQQAALRELNTPLIPLADDVVVMPLIGSIDSGRATQVMETLLEGVSTHRARLAILDITGLPVVDSQVANALLHAAQAVKLLGTEVLLTGIGPEVAQTLVGIGADLSGLKTPGTLQAGIDYALRSKR